MEQGGNDGSRSTVEQNNHSVVTPSTTNRVNYGTDNVEKDEGKVVVTPPRPLGEVEEPPGIDDDKLGGGRVSTNDMKKCEFKRGGMCKTHQIIGKKIVIPSLDWKKDKSGLYKYVRSQQTKYIYAR